MGALQSSQRRRRRSLQRLAKVELQLMLQFLDPASRLRAAQCSRQLLAAADDEFAWACGVFVIRMPSFSGADQLALLQSSLLRHSPIALRVGVNAALPVPAIDAIRRLRELHLHGRRSVQELRTLLSHPSPQQLQVLRLVTQPSPCATVLDMVAALPQLHSLALWCPDDHPDQLQPLLGMAALADFTFLGGGRHSASHLAAIGQLTQLRSLCLSRVPFSVGQLQPFFFSPAMRQLRHLAIDTSLFCTDSGSVQPPADEQRTAFAALERLESLRLRHADGVDALLVHLHCAPSLRLLVLEITPQHPNFAARAPRHPSLAVLQSLLAAAPLLFVQLEGPPSLERWLGHSSLTGFQRSKGADFDPAVAMQWEALQHVERELRPRVAWIVVSDE